MWNGVETDLLVAASICSRSIAIWCSHQAQELEGQGREDRRLCRLLGRPLSPDDELSATPVRGSSCHDHRTTAEASICLDQVLMSKTV